MSDTTRFILSLSIVFAAIIGVIRFKKMDPAFHPFVYYACLGLITEIIIYILVGKEMYQTIAIWANVYGLAEFFLLTWLFHNWGLFKKRKKIFVFIIAFFFFLWFITMLIGGYQKINFYFFIIYSFTLIFFSISSFNRMVVNDRKNIFSNARFWICLGIIIFYTYFILINTAKLSFLKPHLTKYFIDNLQAINRYSNLLVNLLYAIAVIWIPRKKNITTLF
jgi:hypothetical protein